MRRTEWIVGGILGLVVVAVLIALLVYWLNSQPEDEVININNLEYVTALEAYNLALPVARNWSGDAALLSASAGWQPEVDFTNGRASWTMIFYSAAESATSLISVTNARAQLVRTTPLFDPLQPGDVSGWQVDSPEAISSLLQIGAEDFMTIHAKVNLLLTLDVQGTPTWKSTFLDTATKESYSLNITADTGEFTP
jgi:hypothetical protein